jgi:hypothetical protein
MIIAALLWLYKRSFLAFPQGFRAEFEDEMMAVFQELLVQQAKQGKWAVLLVGFEELYHLPVVLLRVHLRAQRKRRIRLPFSSVVYRSPFHPLPVVHDGRFSWWQTVFETSPFIIVGGLLFTIVYIQPAWIPVEWQHQWFDVSGLVALVALPVFIVGFLHDLPRWFYPAGGLLVGHTLFTAQAQGLVIFWIGSLLMGFGLLLTAVYIHVHNQPLAPFLVRPGRSLSLDWTRTAFGFFCMMPYVIISAFDDTYPNNQTAYFALALLIMILGAMAYCRSQRQEQQFGVLVGSVTGVLVVAILEQIYLQSHSLASMVALSTLWVGMMLFLLLPMLASLLCRTWIENRSPQVGS